MAHRRQLLRLSLVLAAVTLAFCTERSSNPVGPGPVDGPLAAKAQGPTGTINVTTTTRGVELDPDGYTVTVDSVGLKPQAKAIPDSGTARFTNANAGTRTVTLTGIAGNCSTATNPQVVQLPAGGTVAVTFAVTCQATTGTLSVNTTTTGVELDPDGYTVTVDGNAAAAKPVATNGTVTFTTLSPGSHTVALSGLAANCTATNNPQTSSITAGATTSASFAVSCVATTGTLSVTAATTGVELDPDGYTVSVDGGTAQPLAVNGSTTVANLAPGSHTVTLAGLAPNCTAAGNPQTTTITAGATSTVAFNVTCATTHGDLTVTTATTGADLDADGYLVSLDGAAGLPVGSNGSITFASLTAGSHTIALSGLAPNCSVTASNPQTVTVTAGATTTAGFTVTCTAIPTTGDLTVTTATTGSDVDPDGYTLTLDGDAATTQPVGVNGSVTFSNLTAGSHTITLGSVAPNCTAAVNPQTVTVTVGSTSTLAFNVDCVTTHGDLRIAAATSGAELDPDGYTVTLNGDAATARTLGSNASVTYTGLAAGTYSATLSSLAPNCSATSNPQMVTVVAGSTTDLAFGITCVATKGIIAVSTVTTGADLDPDGYTLALDGGQPQSIAVNGSLTLTGLAAGAHTIALAAVAANCTVAGSNPQTVSVTAGTTTNAGFAITCTAIPTTGDLTVVATTTGVELDADGYAVSVDGGAAQPLAINGSVSFPGLSAGSHTVTLSALAANCTTTSNPQTITIVAGSSSTVTFNVTCATTKGTISVSTATSGADLDPDGYTVTLDGDAAAAQAIATNGSATFPNLSAGTHSVALSGLAANCALTSASPQTITVTAGATANASFTINCTAIPTTGDLTVTTATTGVELDADGYSVSVDGGTPQLIGDNRSVSFTALAAGSHTVTLSGLASNCSAAALSQTVTVVAGSSASAAFTVNCVTTKGSIAVSTTTSGADLDPDGYAVSIDGNASQAVAANGSTTFANLTAGSHTVALSGLAANCTTTNNPQTATVAAGATTLVAFTITCTAIPTTGALTVTTTTGGVEPDADGYTLSIDGGAPQAIASNASVTIPGLSGGSHVVTLGGVAANCSVTSNPQTATVVVGSTSTLDFSVTCVTTKGSLAISTTTTGADLDPDGYTLTVASDAPISRPIAVNGSVSVTDLSAGAHAVTLSGVAANCTVTSANPQTATVTAGQTTSMSFAIACTAIQTTGDLIVGAATTGVELDPDGYTVSVDGGVARALAINGSTTFTALAAGSHTVTLAGMAPNCTTTSNPQTVTVVAGSSANATFSVTCLTTRGSIAVSTTTTGGDIDPDGYSLSVDGGTAQAIASNGSATLADQSAGTHTLTLSGVAANCSVTGSNPQSVTVIAGATSAATFTITCNTIPTTGDLAVTTATTGVELDADGYTVSIDGGTPQPIAINGSLSVPGLSAGAHTITLAGLATNCTASANPQTATIVAGSSTSAAFAVNCVTTHGDVTVSASTTGVELDPDGYTITMDGDATTAQPLGVNGSATLSGIAAGTHSIAISGLAANCSTTTPSQSVTIVAGSAATTAFNVTCVTTKGTLTVTTSTTGVELDPDGYTASVDGGAAQSIAINGSLTVPGLAAGSHTITLGGIAANCSTTPNPQTANISAGATTTATFSVSCVTTKGAVTVKTSAVGLELDPNGFTVFVDSGGPQSLSRAVGTTDSTTFSNLGAGTHTLTLAGLATNCSIGNSQQTVSITAGATSQAGFAVFCTAMHASTYTLVGAGDIADCARVDDDSTAKVLDRIVAGDAGATVFTLGDNVYDAATATELANCYHPTWGRQKVRTFATLGNHDYKIDANPSWDYFGTRIGPRGLGYYSYNLGDYWHVIVLNDNASYGGPIRTAGSPQDQWLQADLAANTRPCVIAMWHQPMVSSDHWYSASRKIFWDRLYAAHAEIVLNGHLHYYEREYPQTPDLVRDDANGIRQFIVGTGGASTFTPDTLRPNTVVVAPSRGLLKLTLGPGNYSWEFVWAKGQTFTDSGSGTCH